MELKNELLDAKDKLNERRITLRNEEVKARELRRESIHSTRKDTPAENGKLFDIQEKLYTAENALILADNEVEVIHAKIETYKMLVKLEDRANIR